MSKFTKILYNFAQYVMKNANRIEVNGNSVFDRINRDLNLNTF